MNYNPNPGMRNPQGPVHNINPADASMMSSSSPYMQPTTNEAPSMFNPNIYNTAVSSSGIQHGTNYGNYHNVGQMPPPQQQQQQHQQPLQQQQQQQQQQNYGFSVPPTTQTTTTQQTYAASQAPPPPYGYAPAPQQPAAGVGAMPPQFAMFQQPIVQDMAMQYGQRLADQGKQLVENQFEKWVPVKKLKYYFAVDNAYVGRKLRLLFFPFLHKDWSLKYDQEHPVQPRYDINAPDLYLPTMGYITYVVVAGLLLGIQQRFSPEQLGIQASSALAYSIFELVVYSITLYVMNIKTSLKTLDLLAFTGYKYVNIVASLLISTLFYRFGYYSALAYTSLTFGFFLLRTLRTKVLQESPPNAPSGPINYDPYGNPQQYEDYKGGRKRKLYFLFLVVGGQVLFSFLLSKHLYQPAAIQVMNTFGNPLGAN